MNLPHPIKTFIPAQAIAHRIPQLALEMLTWVRATDPIVLVLLPEAVVFASDLLRSLQHPVEVFHVSLTCHPDGTVRLGDSLLPPVEYLANRSILIVTTSNGAFDTLSALRMLLFVAGAEQIRVASLLTKIKIPRAAHIHYQGFSMDNVPVVGYGISHQGRYGTLPFIGVLDTTPPQPPTDLTNQENANLAIHEPQPNKTDATAEPINLFDRPEEYPEPEDEDSTDL